MARPIPRLAPLMIALFLTIAKLIHEFPTKGEIKRKLD